MDQQRLLRLQTPRLRQKNLFQRFGVIAAERESGLQGALVEL
jgi:hypothetical protein